MSASSYNLQFIVHLKKESARPHNGRADVRSGLVNLRTAVIASVDLRVVLPSFSQSSFGVCEVTQVQAIAGIREPCAGNLVDFVVAVRLSNLIDIVLQRLVLLSKRVQARVDKWPDFWYPASVNSICTRGGSREVVGAASRGLLLFVFVIPHLHGRVKVFLSHFFMTANSRIK